MKNLIIPENVVKGLLDYLAQRPWQEVQQVMPILSSLEEHKVAPELHQPTP